MCYSTQVLQWTICHHLFSVMYTSCQNPLWRELAVFTQGLKCIWHDSESKGVTVLSNFPCAERHTPGLSTLPSAGLEGQPCFLFGTSSVLSLYNAEIHGGQARAGVGKTFCWPPEVSLVSASAQQQVRQLQRHHREWNTCTKDKEGHLQPSHQDAKEICICIKIPLSRKGSAWYWELKNY